MSCLLNFHCIVIVFIIQEFSNAECRTIVQELRTPSADEISFMKRYGYLPGTGEGEEDLDFAYTAFSVGEAVRRLQAFAGLPASGVIDRRTRELFKKRRCGVKDIHDNASRSKRYVIQQGWKKKSITYRVLNGSSTLQKPRIEELMERSLEMWAPYGGLSFRRVDDGPADIQVSFVREDHGDGFAFDGPGHTVAHAYPPPHGALHFDDDEVWGDFNDDPDAEIDDDVTDFFAVAVHEVGHALGLSHSNVKASVMYPYYQVPIERLHSDDVLGMRDLYFKNYHEDPAPPAATPAPHPPLPRSTKPDDSDELDDPPSLCDANYDTVQVIQDKIYVFEEEWVWVLSGRKQLEAGPRRLHDVFDGLPVWVNIVKAVYEKENGHIVIFSGRDYWEFSSNFQLLKTGTLDDYQIPAEVSELSSVFLSNFNNKTYLVDYERFWRFDERSGRMDVKYPKSMSAWRKIPYPVDAAFIWEGDTYFFKSGQFWRFENSLVEAHPNYPVPVAPVWFPCEPAPADYTR